MRSAAVAAPVLSLRPRLGRLWYEWRDSGRRRVAAGALTEAVHALPAQPGLPPPARWEVQRVIPTETDLTVAVFGVAAGPPLAVGRITEPGAADAEVVGNSRVVAALCADERLGTWRALLPAPLATGRWRHRAFAVERAVVGRPASRELRGSAGAARVVDVGAAAITTLHRATAVPRMVDEALLEGWVATPLRLLAELGPVPGAGPAAPALRRLADRLREPLVGRPCVTAWTHGDYWCGNLLLDGQGHPAGIVDWGAARDDGLPVTDLLHLLLTARATVEGSSLGDVVAAALREGVRNPGDRHVLAWAEWSWPAGAPDDAAVLLTWLGHVTAALTKRPAYRTDRRWLERNVGAVLRSV